MPHTHTHTWGLLSRIYVSELLTLNEMVALAI